MQETIVTIGWLMKASSVLYVIHSRHVVYSKLTQTHSPRNPGNTSQRKENQGSCLPFRKTRHVGSLGCASSPASPLLLWVSSVAWLELPRGSSQCFHDPVTLLVADPPLSQQYLIQEIVLQMSAYYGAQGIGLGEFGLSPGVTHWLWPIWNCFPSTECLVSSASKSKYFHSFNYLQPRLEAELSRHEAAEQLRIQPHAPTLAFPPWCVCVLFWGGAWALDGERETCSPSCLVPELHSVLVFGICRRSPTSRPVSHCGTG